MQAQTQYAYNIFFEDQDGLVISQIMPCVLSWEWKGVEVKVTLSIDQQMEALALPEGLVYDLSVECRQPCDFSLKIRIPWWVSGTPTIEVEETNYGLRIFAVRDIEPGKRYLRVSNFIFPNLSSFPGQTGGELGAGCGVHRVSADQEIAHQCGVLGCQRGEPV